MWSYKINIKLNQKWLSNLFWIFLRHFSNILYAYLLVNNRKLRKLLDLLNVCHFIKVTLWYGVLFALFFLALVIVILERQKKKNVYKKERYLFIFIFFQQSWIVKPVKSRQSIYNTKLSIQLYDLSYELSCYSFSLWTDSTEYVLTNFRILTLWFIYVIGFEIKRIKFISGFFVKTFVTFEFILVIFLLNSKILKGRVYSTVIFEVKQLF